MTRVLFCVIPEKGHLHPYIGPAQRLQAAGAEVSFHAFGDLSQPLARAGLVFAGEPVEESAAHRGAEFAARVADAAWLRRWIEALLIDAVPPQIDPLRRAIARFRPDVVAIDPMLYAAAIAAGLEGVPWAAISNSLNPVLPDGLDSELLRTVRALAPRRDALFAQAGVAVPRFRGCDLLSPHLTVAFTTEALAGWAVPGVHLVGPSLPDGARGDEPPFPWERLSGAPLVYMSFGSQIYYQPAAFRAVIDAVTDRPVELVLSVSELLDDGALGPLPPNVIAVRYAPQLALLARARAFVTHGGANSVMEAIAAGVPILISPLCNDQPHQAHFLEAAGIGRALDLRRASPRDVWAALDTLLSPGPLRDRLARVTASYQIDGAAETARLLLALSASSRSRRAPA
jgi:UDP:flavonoid glycosyltransferase YjiC (YdhE family)